jgi:glycosyltransferase involved in cell wall biosynthesis
VWFWIISGALLGLLWLRRVLQAFFGMRHVRDLSAPEFDRIPQRRDGEIPHVCVVVPARNEEVHVEGTIRSLLALDYPRIRIVAVDDRSTDATGEILDRLAAEAPARLQVLHVKELPAGWLGKTHAMWLAAQQLPDEKCTTEDAEAGSGDQETGRQAVAELHSCPALSSSASSAYSAVKSLSGDWLLFTDADTIFRPDSLRRAIVYAQQCNADHLAVFPKIDTATFGGHVMVAFFGVLFLFWRRPWKVNDPEADDAIGLGVFNLIRREAYEQIGTWQALRLSVVEDVKLGELVKQRGLRQMAALGQDLLTNFWAHDAFSVVENLSKNFFAAARYKVSRALGICALFLIFHVLPYVAVFVAPGLAKIGFGLALVAIALMYIGMSRQPNVSPFYFFTHPFAALLFVYIMLRSMTLALSKGGVTWRGTTYPLEELRQGSGLTKHF